MKTNAKEIEQEKSKPWLDVNGKMKPDLEIQKIMHQWAPDVWESYLVSLEFDSTEALLDDPQKVEEIPAGDYASMLFSVLEKEKEFPNLNTSIHVALRRLSPRERQIIEMKYWEELSNPAIAEKLNISASTVRVYIVRGLEKVKAGLKTLGPNLKVIKAIQTLQETPGNELVASL